MADRAVGELARMHARLGHASELEALLAELGPRAMSGPSTELLAGAREGLWSFRNDYGRAYLCGPMALRNVLAALGADQEALDGMIAQRSGPQGFSLAQVSALADEVGLRHRLVRRAPQQPIPVPSVVHWKLDHYAAIVDEKDGRFLVQDPTFASGDAWLTQAAIDEESSGFFLVPDIAGSDASWQLASAEEAQTVRGMGWTNNNEPGNTTPEAEGLRPATCNRMCEANAKTMLVSLNLNDTPVGYTPPKGPPVQVRVSYNQRESGQPAVFGFFNVSPKWSLNVLSWIEDDPLQPGVGVVRHVGGGGSIGPLDYLPSTYSPVAGTFGPERISRSVLARLPGTGAASAYELRMPDGSKQVFARSDGAASAPRRMFLSQVIDPAGNASSYNYDAQLRLVSITDASGRNTTFGYGSSASPLLVTRITDPFGRHADLAYDDQGRLASITDVIGITSSFGYDAGGLVNSMTTPYGTSRFRYGEDTGANTRYLEMRDPLGLTERVEFAAYTPGIPDSEPRAPTMSGPLLNAYQVYRNSFYWDKGAFARAPGNYGAARNTHWLHNPNGMTSPIAESTKAPLETRVFRLYPGQWSGYYESSSGVPNEIARVLDDGTTQRTAYAHNAFGKPLSITDPAGRTTLLTYAANGVDLLSTQQQTAGGALTTLASATYNAQHQPLTRTDTAGQVTRYAYNAAGQPTGVTDALGRTTSYAYDAIGRLTKVLNPDGSTRLALAYDGFDRVASSTGSEGYTQTFQYDALDRITQVTYPDGSTTQHAYDRLDRVATKDRAGRITRYAYDANRRLVAVTDPLGQVTAYTYHPNGALQSITDPKGNTTTWDVDIQGRPVAKRFADGSAETYAYDGSGRLQSVTDAQGQAKLLAYTVDDRLASTTYANARVATPGVSYSHDPFFPRVVSMTDGVGTTTYTYNPAGSPGAHQLAAVTNPVAGQPGMTDTVSYTYDALGRSIERNVAGVVDKRGYDALGRTASTQNALGSFAYGFVGASARVATVAAGDGLQVAMKYFGAGGDELLRQIDYTSAGAPLASYGYTYDAVRNVASFAQALPGERLAALDPGAMNGAGGDGSASPWRTATEVASSDRTAMWLGMTLSTLCLALIAMFTRRSGAWRRGSARIGAPLVALALMASCGGGGGGGSAWPDSGVGTGTGGATAAGPAPPPTPTAQVTLYTYDASDRLLGAATALNVPGAPVTTSHAYGYDKAANLVSMQRDGDVERRLEVTNTNALAAGSYDASGNPTSLGAARFEWDGAHRLVGHAVNNGETSFVYDGRSRVVRIVERQAGAVVADRSYLWCGLQRCLERDNTQAGSPVSKRYFEQGVVQGGEAFRYATDALGSVRQLVDASGQTRTRYDYDPYGYRTKIGGDVDADASFAGLFKHRAGGLDLAVYCAYDQQRGRWLNRDPIGEEGGLNLYAYAGSNPATFTDSKGLDWIYNQRSGQLSHQPSDAVGGGPPHPIDIGYTGRGSGLDNPALELIPNVGPIPAGEYTIQPQQNNITRAGHALSGSMRLTPDPGNWMYGRGGFLIHGDNSRGNNSASEGCIILGARTRNSIANSGDTRLRVIP